jgi:hypothetical protein
VIRRTGSRAGGVRAALTQGSRRPRTVCLTGILLASTPLLSSCAPAASPTLGGSATAAARASPPRADALAGCPEPRDFATLPVLARLPGDDDDLLATQGGDIWVSQPQTGRVLELDPGGAVLRTFSDPSGPEGLALAPDGRLFLAEQRTNHIVLLDTRTGTRSLFATAPGRAGLDVGIDGLGLDPAGNRLLVPDSPEGTLLALPLSGSGSTTLASGLGRDVSASVDSGGTVLVGVEHPPGLLRISEATGAPVVSAGTLRSVDEVVVSGAIAYVTDLGAGTVDAVDPRDGRLRVLVSGAAAPQGLAVMSSGRLLLADSVRSELVTLPACST